ncbi:Nn.00g084390.m01.CDS01 [Neocucurbitaria sp. VM-36]
MSIMGSPRNRFGKRSRDTNDEPQDQGAPQRVKITKESYVSTPRRRSVRLAVQTACKENTNEDSQSPPGTYPGTEEYAPEEVHSPLEERKKAMPNSKAARGHTSGIVVTPVKEMPALSSGEERSTPEVAPAIHKIQEDAHATTPPRGPRAARTAEVQAQAPVAVAIQPLQQRRQSFLNHPYAFPRNASEHRVRKRARNVAAKEQLPTPSPTPSPPSTSSLKVLLADPNTPIAKAHKALEEAYSNRMKASRDVSRQRKSLKNNIFSRLQSSAQGDIIRELQPVVEDVVDIATTVSDKPIIEDLVTCSSESQIVTSSPPAALSGETKSHRTSPATSNESSSDESATSYPSTRGSRTRDSDNSSTKTPSSLASVMTEMSTHFAAQNEALAKKLGQVSEAIALTSTKSLEAQQLITQLATRPPTASTQSQSFVDPVALEQAIERKVNERYEAKLKLNAWAPQKEKQANGYASTKPREDYFDPRSALRKNRVVLPVERSRSILEAHEVQYRYQLQDCPVQKLLGLPRILKPEASFYASLRTVSKAIIELSTYQQAAKPIQNEWAKFQASIPARRGSDPMDFEETGAPMDIEEAGPPAVNQTWNPSQAVVFSQPQPLPCRNWAQGRVCKYGDRCKFSHAPNVTLSVQKSPLEQFDEELANIFDVIAQPLEWSWVEVNSGDNYQSLLKLFYDSAEAISAALKPCSSGSLRQSAFADQNIPNLVPALKNWWKEISGNAPIPDDLFRAIGALKAVVVQASKMMGGKWDTNRKHNNKGGFDNQNYFQNGRRGEHQGGMNWSGPTNHHGSTHGGGPGGQIGGNNNQSLLGAPSTQIDAPTIDLAKQSTLLADLDEILKQPPKNGGARSSQGWQQPPLPQIKMPLVDLARQTTSDANLDQTLQPVPTSDHGRVSGDSQQPRFSKSKQAYYIAAFDQFLRDNPRKAPRQNSGDRATPRIHITSGQAPYKSYGQMNGGSENTYESKSKPASQTQSYAEEQHPKDIWQSRAAASGVAKLPTKEELEEEML